MEDRLNAPAGRLHALDNLRALMMWLGIVLHVAVIHGEREALLPWRDERRTALADFLMAFIHAFRMPVFFILAGYFVALLARSRGAGGLARHRLRRLGLPFLVFWPPVFAACVVLSLLFLHRIVRGSWGLDRSLMADHPTVPQGPSTMHMWFLWLLLWFSLLAAALLRWFDGPWLQRGAAILRRLGSTAWGPVVLTLPLVLAGLGYPDGLVRPNGAFLPPAAEWLHNGMFFVFGLALLGHQQPLFDLYRRRCKAYALAGVLPFVAAGALVEAHAPAVAIAFVYNMSSWLWSFALIGLALRVLDRRSAWLSYLADSSYWVYLVHMPLTIGLGALLFGLALPAVAKMAINISATTLVCLVSYQLFVRFTWVSVLLNGKRHVRSAGDLQHSAPRSA
jgi:glucans biosynthesis protein C